MRPTGEMRCAPFISTVVAVSAIAACAPEASNFPPPEEMVGASESELFAVWGRADMDRLEAADMRIIRFRKIGKNAANGGELFCERFFTLRPDEAGEWAVASGRAFGECQ